MSHFSVLQALRVAQPLHPQPLLGLSLPPPLTPRPALARTASLWIQVFPRAGYQSPASMRHPQFPDACS